MLVIESWAPLLICIRQGHRDPDEVAQLAAGFQHHFARRQRYAVLNVSALTATASSARDRLRIAEWANREEVRRASRELCVGSATVVARAWERQTLTALQWLWTPAAPHQPVTTVRLGLAYCITALTAAQVPLPVSPDTFSRSIERALAQEAVAGLEPVRERTAQLTKKKSNSADLQTLTREGGSVSLGWLGNEVLWVQMSGHLSEQLASAYTMRLAELLEGRSGIQFFVDSSRLETYELSARGLATEFLLAFRTRFSRYVLLNWAGGLSSSGRNFIAALGSAFESVATPEEFGRRLRSVAPGADERIAGLERTSPDAVNWANQ